MIVGVPKETYLQERRVALVPDVLSTLSKSGVEVIMEAGAGTAAGYPDGQYEEKGAVVVARAELFERADVVLQVRTFPANAAAGRADLEDLRPGQTVIGMADPLTALQEIGQLAQCQVMLFALELMPRITRAQSMDILSSMATVAGYKAVLLAAAELPRIFPLLMTAAGTLAPARVLVIGAGVAGLQAIATARRLGAVVQAYDVRPAVREQVESLGGRFVELQLDSEDSEDAGGYAKAQDEDFYRRQQEELAKVVAANDVVVTTAAIPGQQAPILITEAAVAAMASGSVVVDLAAERGGNCALTQPGDTVEIGGVKIMGPLNLPSTAPYHASQMYAHNISTFLRHLVEDGNLAIDLEDEITRETLIARGGEVVHARVRELIQPSVPAAPRSPGDDSAP